MNQDLLNLQADYNYWLNVKAEMIRLAPKCPWIGRTYPWWRIDVRLRNWMVEWDWKFAARYR